MHEPSGPPEFEPREWANIDLGRWHLDGLPVDAATAAVAELSERLFGSEEWRKHFQGTLPGLQRGVLALHRERAAALEAEKTAVGREFDERIAAAERRREEFGKTIETSGSPPVIEPDSEAYHLAVRVTAADVQVGLPGLVVQVSAPRDAKTVLAHAVTDLDGNALITVAGAKPRDSDQADSTLEILTASAKSLEKIADAVCVRPGQSETKIIALKDSPGIAPHKTAALALRAERDARARDLVTAIERVTQERQARLQDLDRRLDENRKIIADLEAPPVPPTPPSAPEEPPDTRSRSDTPPVRERPPARRTGRRRR